MEYLFISGITLSFLLITLLVLVRKKHDSHKILILFFGLAILSISYILYKYLNTENSYISIFSEINQTVPILYGLLIYYYTQSIIYPDFKIAKKVSLIVIIFLFYLGMILIRKFTSGQESYSISRYFFLLKPVFNLFMIWKVHLLILKVQKEDFWNSKNQHFRTWLSIMLIGTIIVCLLAILGFIFQTKYPKVLKDYGDFWICSFLAVLIFCLCIVAMKTGTFDSKAWWPKTLSSKIEKDRLNEKANLDKSYYDEITRLILKERLYLDPDLTVSKLAQLMELPIHKVSSILNERGNTSFNELVNKYRVEEVKKMIVDKNNDHLTLLALGLTAGFNSKSSFNRIFKDIVGMTPTQYKKLKM